LEEGSRRINVRERLENATLLDLKMDAGNESTRIWIRLYKLEKARR
jgi:hypothetical protein